MQRRLSLQNCLHIHSVFIYLLNKYLLSINLVPFTELGAGTYTLEPTIYVHAVWD